MYIVPEVEVTPEKIQMVMISEAAPRNRSDYYYQGRGSLFEQTTLQAFREAEIEADSLSRLVDRGVYFTTAIKCGKKGYIVKSAT